MRGRQIATVEDVQALALEHRSVCMDAEGQRPMPAAVVVNMPAAVVLSRLARGLYVYERPAKPNWTQLDPKGAQHDQRPDDPTHQS